ncbi:hypothetical protein BBO99_00001533 [Phytophthora kernoviae]|uniref:PH domain-containing protein n=2 Tax=Phytophthora kernoviae TaxID=325452 RepID=A0A3R7KXT4_9STRA|nr:hypothetical protein G195_003730 [Phytophthora kernoviae 00238/432]KAG2530137.1 hypothetical protein JM18_002405 [Phytophthora kernoviae]KAG2531364.1 hypothetical protein JM16_001085 [Phytophthora kernoviae]RLN20335.1 hypothetical protein BBI17_001356 [Phytophthora kernoviae]RLN84168.1 hypothetical protein BBO99_00001533 [Phytophthora kernoviae]
MSSVSSSHTTTPLPQGIHIQGWMYWARHEDSEATRSSERYTKVYAVLRNEFLLLYRNNQRQSKKVEDLSRGSVYRGTLHDFRVGQESSIRKSVMHIKKFNRWQSLRKFIPSRVSSRLKYSRSSS